MRWLCFDALLLPADLVGLRFLCTYNMQSPTYSGNAFFPLFAAPPNSKTYLGRQH